MSPSTPCSRPSRSPRRPQPACADHADEHLRADLRPDRVAFRLSTTALGTVTARDAELAGEITAAIHGLGKQLLPPTGGHPPQFLEIAIDALDIAAVRPFWLAVLGYTPEPGTDAAHGLHRRPHRRAAERLVPADGRTARTAQPDPLRPARRARRGRRRIQAALDAGGVLVSDAAARSFWILADAEDNEICICTWQDRERG